MARSPEGWSLYRDPRTRTWIVRFRVGGRRLARSTGTGDRREAAEEAARIYREAQRVAGPVVPRGRTPFDESLVAAWLRDYGAAHSPETVEAYESYAAVHWMPRWTTVEAIDERALGDYVRDRLRVVTASTVRKETSALRSLLGWLVDTGRRAAATEVPSVPKRATGTPYQGGKRTPRRVPLSPTQVAAIVAAMPPGDARDAVELIWETTLRHATIARLERPRHYRPGAGELVITADVDKARMARTLPLSPRAVAILDAHAGRDGLLFPGLALRRPLAAAALAAGLPADEAVRVSPHDLRHAAITDLVSRPGVSLGGAAYLAGHQHVSTTALYAHPGREAAEAALVARFGIPDRDTEPARAKAPKRRAKKSPVFPG